MIGHQQVIAARRAGWKPAAVFLNIGTPPPGNRVAPVVEHELADGFLPAVYTAGDDVRRADLRWAHGLRVHVLGTHASSETFWGWWDALVAAVPARLIGVEPDGEVIEWRP